MSEIKTLPKAIPYTRKQEHLAVGDEAFKVVNEFSSPELYSNFKAATMEIVMRWSEKNRLLISDRLQDKVAFVLIQPMIHPHGEEKITGCLFAIYKRSEKDPDDLTLFDQLFLELNTRTNRFVSVKRDIDDNFPLTLVK